MTHDEIIELIKKEIEIKKVSQAELSEHANTTESSISRYLHTPSKMPFDIVVSCLSVLGYEVDVYPKGTKTIIFDTKENNETFMNHLVPMSTIEALTICRCLDINNFDKEADKIAAERIKDRIIEVISTDLRG